MIRTRQLSWVCLVLLLAAWSPSQAADAPAKTNARSWRVSLATNGVPGSTILCDTENRFDNFAAQELQRCVKELTDVDMEIVDVSERSTVVGPCVYIGDTDFARVMGEVSAELPLGGYRIRVLPRSLIITAHNSAEPSDEESGEQEQAIVCAVYDLIGRLGAVRWEQPGEIPERAAKKKRLVASGSKPIESTSEAYLAQYVSETTEEEPDLAEEDEVEPELEEAEPDEPAVPLPAEAGGKRYANRRILPHAYKSWCVSTDTNKLNLIVEEVEGEYRMSNVASYNDPSKAIYYFVNWDLVGTPDMPGTIESYRVEQDRLYLVHIYEINAPATLADFGKTLKNSGKNAYVAWVWVGRGDRKKDVGGRVSSADEGVSEIRETPDWFFFNPKERLPTFSRQFPQFALPEQKHFSIGQYAEQDQAKNYLSRGITHLQGAMAEGYPIKRHAATIANYFADGLIPETSTNPRMSPTEQAFMKAPITHILERMDGLKENDYIFLAEELWDSNYQLETIERLIVAVRRGKENYPALKIGDWWAGIPYNEGFVRRGTARTSTFDPMRVARDYDPAVAVESVDTTFTVPVKVDGNGTTYGDELTCLPVNLHVGPAFSHPAGFPKNVSESDLTVPTAIHKTRVNRLLPMNDGKPEVWYTWGLLDLTMDHPPVSFPTQLRTPEGVVVIRDRMQISPDLCEAISFFSFFEAEGCQLREEVGVSRNDPNDIVSTYHHWAGAGQVPRLAEWIPRKEGAPPRAKTPFVYPYCLRFDVDYVALGAWKYSEIASICELGRKQDLTYSMDGGTSWITPPIDRSTMCQSVSLAQPIVVGTVMDEQAAVAIYHPYQAPDELTKVTVKLNQKEVTFQILGKRVHVYKVDL